MRTSVVAGGVLAIGALALFAACGTDPAPVAPNLAFVDPDPGGGNPGTVSGVNCVFGGDFAFDEVFSVDECYKADNGFSSSDVTARFRFWDRPVYGPINPKHVYFVHEVRHTAAGSGYRIAWAGFFTEDTLTTGTFGLPLYRELQAAGFEAFVGGCPSTYTSATACAQWAFANESHDEPRLCIWNATVGAGGTASQYCDGKVWGSFTVNQLPVARLSATEVSRTSTSAVWRFNASSSSDPEGQALTYRWDFSDGFSHTSTNPVYDRTFTAAGTYSVRLRVTDASGGLDVRRGAFSVVFDPANQAPTADFTYSCQGLTCTFVDRSTDPDGTIVSWLWDFGDGQSSAVQSPSHTFPSANSYAVHLTVTDDDGAPGETTKTVTVTDAPLSVSIDGATSVSANTICTWFASPRGGTGGYTYQWTRDLSVVGTSSSYDGNTGSKSFILTVKVWSGTQSASSSLKVSVQSGNPLPC